jgi:hypothetical protein
VQIKLLKEAERRVEKTDAWWRKNRPYAPDLFGLEFEQALEHLKTSPESGVVHRRIRNRTIRIWLMEKTQRHIYYRFDRNKQLIVIYSVWGAVRGRAPAIR